MNSSFDGINISVLLPVRNGLPYIREAVASIQSQDIDDWELIVVDDGSTDGTNEWLCSLQDKRIKIILSQGKGLVSALNFGLAHCSGEYVARMDADDISDSSRLRIQREVLLANPNVAVVCSNIEKINEAGCHIGVEIESYKNREDIVKGLNYQRSMKPIVHPSALIRRRVLSDIDGYREFTCAEDKDLWLRILSNWDIYRTPEILLRYRMTANGISRSRRLEQSTNSLLATINYLAHQNFGIDIYGNKNMLFVDLKKITEAFIKNQMTAEESFDEFKQKAKRRHISALMALIKGLYRHKNRFYPSARDSEKYQFALELVNKISVAK